MNLSAYGQIVERCWRDLPNHYPHIDLDEYVVMPNHFHGIVWIRGDRRAGSKPAPTADGRAHPLSKIRGDGRAGLKPAPTADGRPHPLSEIVRAFKTFSARRINQMRSTPGVPVWQRNYYERVVRNERELNASREYIHTNPIRWHLDKENPSRIA
jgi:REP element-mobilizing transposase RayT